MVGSDSGNAMTEIALALAMAFFAIMILTMVSMGGKGSAAVTDRADAASRSDLNPPPDGLRLLPSAKQAATVQNGRDARVLEPHQLIIFSGGRFLDDKLQPLDAAKIAAMSQPVLAVPPEMSLAEAMAAKGRLALPNLTVTTLNRHWLEAIKEHQK